MKRINEKIFMFLWFWFIFLAGATAVNFLRWLFRGIHTSGPSLVNPYDPHDQTPRGR